MQGEHDQKRGWSIFRSLHRVVAIVAAWGLGWLVYMIAMVVTVYDGLLSMILQPIMGAIITTLAVLSSLILGLVFRIPIVGKAWKAAWFLAPTFAAVSLLLLCFGARWGLTETFTDFETGSQFVGLRSDVAIGSFLLMIFGISNWPAKP